MNLFPCEYSLAECEESNQDFTEPCQMPKLVNYGGVWKEHWGWLPINNFIWSHFRCSMVGSIVPPFSEREPLFH